MNQRRFPTASALLLCALLGCSSEPPSTGTGAQETAQEFCDALVRQDWERGHALLSAASQARCSRTQFAQRGRAHRRSLGFEPESGRVRFCEEHGTQAIAHIVFTGRNVTRQRYPDALTLERSETGWRVVLPARFGQSR